MEDNTPAPRFRLPVLVEEAREDTVAILGKSGSGKTYMAKGEAESLLAMGKRVCVIDPMGAWWGLGVLPDLRTPSGLPVIVFGGENAHKALTPLMGRVLGRIVAENHVSVVLDLSDMAPREQYGFLDDFLAELYHLNRKRLYLFVDEVDEFAPQRERPETRSVANQINRIVRRGRKKGFCSTLITQRSAVVSKDLLSQAGTLVAFRQTSPQDRAVVRSWIEHQGNKAQVQHILATLASLEAGTGWIHFPAGDLLRRVKFPELRTYDSSRKPGEDEEVAEVALPTIDSSEIDQLISEAGVDGPAHEPGASASSNAASVASLRMARVATWLLDSLNRVRSVVGLHGLTMDEVIAKEGAAPADEGEEDSGGEIAQDNGTRTAEDIGEPIKHAHAPDDADLPAAAAAHDDGSEDLGDDASVDDWTPPALEPRSAREAATARMVASEIDFTAIPADAAAQHLASAGADALDILADMEVRGEAEVDVKGRWRLTPYGRVTLTLPPAQAIILLAVATGIVNERLLRARVGDGEIYDQSVAALQQKGIAAYRKTHLEIVNRDYAVAPGEDGAPEESELRRIVGNPHYDDSRLHGTFEGAKREVFEQALMSPSNRRAIEAAAAARHRPHTVAKVFDELLAEGHLERDGQIVRVSAQGHREIVMTANMRRLHDALMANGAMDERDIGHALGWTMALTHAVLAAARRDGYVRRSGQAHVALALADGDDGSTEDDRGSNDAPHASTVRNDAGGIAGLNLTNQNRREIARTLVRGPLQVRDVARLSGRTAGAADMTLQAMERDGEANLVGETASLTTLGLVARTRKVTEARLLLALAAGIDTEDELGPLIGDAASYGRVRNGLWHDGIISIVDARVTVADARYDAKRIGFAPADIRKWLQSDSARPNHAYGRVDGYAAVIVRRLADGPASRQDLAGLATTERGREAIEERLAAMVEADQVADDGGALRLTATGVRDLALEPQPAEVYWEIHQGRVTEQDIIERQLGRTATGPKRFGVHQRIKKLIDKGFVAQDDDGTLRTTAGDASDASSQIWSRRSEKRFPHSLHNSVRETICRHLDAGGPATIDEMTAVPRTTRRLVLSLEAEGMLRRRGDRYEPTELMHVLYGRARNEGRALLALNAGLGDPEALRKVLNARGTYSRTTTDLVRDRIIAMEDGAYVITDERYRLAPGTLGRDDLLQALAESMPKTGQKGPVSGTAAEFLQMLRNGPLTRQEATQTLTAYRAAWKVEAAIAQCVSEGLVHEQDGVLELTNKAHADALMSPLDRKLRAMLDRPLGTEEIAARLGMREYNARTQLTSALARGYIRREGDLWMRTPRPGLDEELERREAASLR